MPGPLVGSATARAPAERQPELRRTAELVAHLARREVAARQRFTLLGWAWPLVRQLAQLGVLLVVFTSILDLGIDNYPVFLFTGLVAWAWFSSALSAGCGAILAQRHLVFRPHCPAAALPVVPVTVALVDVLIALPVLLLLAGVDGDLGPSVLFLPVIGLVQFVLLCGLAWLTAAATVYLRDVEQLVLVALTLLFYLTPVFYEVERLPSDYHWLFRLNPMTTLIEAYRDVLLAGHLPGAGSFLALTGAALAVAALSLAVFQRLRPGFVDEL